MPKVKYSKNFENLRLITSYLGLGNKQGLKILCEKIERLNNSTTCKSKLEDFYKEFENSIFPKVEMLLESKIIHADKSGCDFYSNVKAFHFHKIENLLLKHGIGLNEPKKYKPTDAQFFFHNLPRLIESEQTQRLDLPAKSSIK